MHRVGAHHIALKLPTVHMPHDPPPAGEGEARPNFERMQRHQREGVLTPNGDRWGLEPRHDPFGHEITEAMWRQIKAEELASWTAKAWPSLEGKLHRERKYLQQAVADLDLLRYLPEADTQQVWLDVGCGPYSILELVPGDKITRVCMDPLHSGYEDAGLRKVLQARCRYVQGRGELLGMDDSMDNHVAMITSINGIDHYRSPRQTLVGMVALVQPGGHIALHYCVNNASEGHPHPAHRIDLDIPEMLEWGNDLGLKTLQAKYVHYGWRHQKAAAIVFEKAVAA
jgi:hypothetical protein